MAASKVQGQAERDERASLYAQWAAFDAARTLRGNSKAADGAASTPEKAVEAVSEAEGAQVAEKPKAAPAGSKAFLKPMCLCGQRGEYVPGVFSSVATGRVYEPRVSPGGVNYGLQRRTRFVMVTAGGHTLERGVQGRPDVGRHIDEMVAKLKVRAETIAAAKIYLRKPEHHATLDAWLQRSMKFPSKWRTAHKQVVAAIESMGLKEPDRGSAIRTFNRRSFRATWET